VRERERESERQNDESESESELDHVCVSGRGKHEDEKDTNNEVCGSLCLLYKKEVGLASLLPSLGG